MCKLLLPIAALVLVAFTGNLAAQNAKVDIRGKITKLTPATDAQKAAGILAVVLIVGTKTPEDAHDRAFVKITKDTKLWKQTGMNKQPATVMDLKLDSQVTSQFKGPVLESYPVQATAGELTLLIAAAANDPK